MTKNKRKLTASPADTDASPASPTDMLRHIDAADTLVLTDTSTATEAHARIPELTPKQRKYVHNVVAEGMSKTEAYLASYAHTGTRKSAHEEASRTSRLPQVKLELDKYSALAENTMIEVMETSNKFSKSGDRDGAAYAAVAVSAAKDVLDRVHGKATQRVETTTKAVVLNIDLTGVS